jgi:hypothetical protein
MATRVGRAPKEFVLDYGRNVASEFELWLEDVNDYMAICKVEEPAEKKSLFLNLAGLSLRRIVKGLVVGSPGEGSNEYMALTDAILAHFRPSVNTTSERHRFRQMKQDEHESVTAFVGRLRSKVELCDFASTAVDTVVNGQVRDQLIAGLRRNDIRRELLKEAKLTLSGAVSRAVALEASIADSSLYEGSRLESHPEPAGTPSGTVNKVSQQNPPSRGNTVKCRYCGRQHTKGKQYCPAADTRCSYCRKMGHFAAVCLQRKKTTVAQIVVTNESPDTELEERSNRVYDTVYVARDPQQAEAFRTTLKVNGKECTGLLDTGATRTLITEDIVTATRPSVTVLKAYDGRPVTTLGVADVVIQSGTKTCTCTCFVVPVGQTVLFGQDIILQLGLLSHNEVNMVRINPVGITVDPQATPVALPPRRHAFSLRTEIEAELDRLQQADVIEPERSY